jgi:hypothetical protein
LLENSEMSSPEMAHTPQPLRSHLFRLRLWKEELEDDLAEWRGKVEHVTGEEAYYFRTWEGLIQILTDAMDDGSQE